MTPGIRTFIYPVSNLAHAKKLYGRLLGVEPYVDEAYYVGFRVGDQELGLDPNGHREGAVGYWQVDDIETTVEDLRAAGGETLREVEDVGGGLRIAWVRDADGNVIGLRQPA